MQDCLFCNIDREVIAENNFSYAIYDSFPVSEGHILIVPKRHFSSYFEATDLEIISMHNLIKLCHTLLEEKYQPDGYNIGVNVAEAGGQSIFHLHLHLIPRYQGDVDFPRGGVRNIIPHEGHHG